MAIPMMILHTQVTIDRSYGGPARTVPALCDAVARQATQNVTLVSSCSDQVSAEYLQGSFFRLVLSGGRDLSTFLMQLNELGDCGDCDLLHDHGLWLPSNMAAAKYARKTGIPYILTPRGMLEPWCLKHKAVKKKVAWWMYQKRIIGQAVLLHATAEEEAESLRKLGLRQPIAVIPNGVDFPEVLPEGSKKTNFKTALFLGRVYPVKGLVNLVKAWADVRPEGWQLMIAGPDEAGHAAELKELATQLGLSWTNDCSFNRSGGEKSHSSLSRMSNGTGRDEKLSTNHLVLNTNDIVFTGALDDEQKWQAYADADLFVLPTFSENFGVVVAEAMAAGVPVITTKGAPWKVLEEKHCGWWIDVGVEPLVEALKKATSISDEERKEMGLGGKKVAYERFDWQNIGSQMVDVYEWVLGKSGKRPDCVRLD
jgi:glycosyltransferase involved in cell wall biosynthesis